MVLKINKNINCISTAVAHVLIVLPLYVEVLRVKQINIRFYVKKIINNEVTTLNRYF